MTLEWTDFPGAPAPGIFLCNLSEVAQGQVHFLNIGDFPVLLVATAKGLRAYVNACPHQFLPLDQRSPSVLSADGLRLMCSNHQAEFDIDAGTGTGGLGLGCALSQVPLKVESDEVRIA